MAQVVVLLALMEAWDLAAKKKWKLKSGMTLKEAKASAPAGVTFDGDGNVTVIRLSDSDLSGARYAIIILDIIMWIDITSTVF